MPEKYTLRGVQIQLEGGAVVTADVSTVEGLKSLIDDLARVDLTLTKPVGTGRDEQKDDDRSHKRPHDADTPAARMEGRAGLKAGTLDSTGLLAFKDDVPQLLRPNQLKVSDALVLLLFAVETGLKQVKIPYDAFKDLYDAQNIKGASPLAMRVTDLRNAGYLDTKIYQADRSLRLTAKGEKKAIEMLKRTDAAR